MTTKKKSTAINPVLDFSAGIPTNVNQNLSQIPNYDDVGISFKGFSKSPIDGSSYRLNKQTSRFYSCYLAPNTAIGTYNFARSDLPQNFYCTCVQIDISTAGINNIIVYDGVVANARMKIVAGSSDLHYVINFATPKLFSGTQISINIDKQVTATTGFIHLCFHGWQE